MKYSNLLKKVFSVLVAVFAVFALGACNRGDGDRETLRMATSADFPPFEFVCEITGEYDGFDIHLARAIADVLDKELVISNMVFDAVITAVTTGYADMAVAAISITPERLESVLFSTPYFETTQVVIVRNDSHIRYPGQLDDPTVSVVVQMGTTSDTIVTSILELEANIVRLNTATDTILELNTGRVDAIVIDEAVAMQFIDMHPNFVILESPLAMEEYAIAVNRGNNELLTQINDALAQLVASGEYQRIYNLFFGGE